MNLKHAVAVLAKKFVVNPDTFKALSKAKIIDWAKDVVAANLLEKRDGLENMFKLSRDQHAFLIGEIRSF